MVFNERQLFCPLFLLISIASTVNPLASVLISSPFDNFRIECPQTSGAQRLGIRMVESQGMKRQDTVFVLSCQHVGELYPWLAMPEDVAEIEREDCHYTQQFDVLLEQHLNWTCREREYLAGIARLADTRIQMECCRLRTRAEANCVELEYDKPLGSGSRIEIEYQAKLINGLAIEEDVIRVRFCDLAPRQIEQIMAETPKTTTTRRTTASPVWTPAWRQPQHSFRSATYDDESPGLPLLNHPKQVRERLRTATTPSASQAFTEPAAPFQPNAPPEQALNGADYPDELALHAGEDITRVENAERMGEEVEPNHQHTSQQLQAVHQWQFGQNQSALAGQGQPVVQHQHDQPGEIVAVQQQEQRVQAVQQPEQRVQAVQQPEQRGQAVQQQEQRVQAVQGSQIRPHIRPAQTIQFGPVPRLPVQTVQLVPHHFDNNAQGGQHHSVKKAQPEEEARHSSQEQNGGDFFLSQKEAQNGKTSNRAELLATRTLRVGGDEQDRVEESAQNDDRIQSIQSEQQDQRQKLISTGQLDRRNGSILDQTDHGKRAQIATDHVVGRAVRPETDQAAHPDQRVPQTDPAVLQRQTAHPEQEAARQDQHGQSDFVERALQHGLSAQAAQPDQSASTGAPPLTTKSSLMIRKKGQHEFTVTLMPPDERQRQNAELAIQHEVDAIRALEKQFQVKTITLPSPQTPTKGVPKPGPVQTVALSAPPQVPKVAPMKEEASAEAMHRILFGEPSGNGTAKVPARNGTGEKIEVNNDVPQQVQPVKNAKMEETDDSEESEESKEEKGKKEETEKMSKEGGEKNKVAQGSKEEKKESTEKVEEENEAKDKNEKNENLEEQKRMPKEGEEPKPSGQIEPANQAVSEEEEDEETANGKDEGKQPEQKMPKSDAEKEKRPSEQIGTEKQVIPKKEEEKNESDEEEDEKLSGKPEEKQPERKMPKSDAKEEKESEQIGSEQKVLANFENTEQIRPLKLNEQKGHQGEQSTEGNVQFEEQQQVQATTAQVEESSEDESQEESEASSTSSSTTSTTPTTTTATTTSSSTTTTVTTTSTAPTSLSTTTTTQPRPLRRLRIHSIQLQQRTPAEIDSTRVMPTSLNNARNYANLARQNRVDANEPVRLRSFSIDLRSGGQTQATPASSGPARQSDEVRAAHQSMETIFPMAADIEMDGGHRQRDEDDRQSVENVREASNELLHSIAGVMEAKQKARKIIAQVREQVQGATRSAPSSSREFAESMIREIEKHETMMSALDDAEVKAGVNILAQIVHQTTTTVEPSTTSSSTIQTESSSPISAPASSKFTSPAPLGNLTVLFGEDAEPEDISVEVAPSRDEVPSTNEPPATTTTTTTMPQTNGGAEDTKEEKADAGVANEAVKPTANASSTEESAQKPNDENALRAKAKAANIVALETEHKEETQQQPRVQRRRKQGGKKAKRPKPKHSQHVEAVNESDVLPAELPPLEAFPSPPPASAQRRGGSTAPPQLPLLGPSGQSKATLRLVKTTTEAPSTAQRSTTLADLDYEVASGEDSETTEATAASTRWSPGTPIPIYKRRLLAKTTQAAEFEGTTRHSTRRILPPRRQPTTTQSPPSHSGAQQQQQNPLPDELTDESPFDAERNRLIQRLRHLQRVDTIGRNPIVDEQQEEKDQFTSGEQKARSTTQSEPESTITTTEEVPKTTTRRQRSRFERPAQESRFDKESPFEGRRGAAKEIRRKPSIASFPQHVAVDAEKVQIELDSEKMESESADAAVVSQKAEKENISIVVQRDGIPLYAPLDNRPMQMPPKGVVVGERNDLKADELHDALVPMSGGNEEAQPETGGEEVWSTASSSTTMEQTTTTTSTASSTSTTTTTERARPSTHLAPKRVQPRRRLIATTTTEQPAAAIEVWHPQHSSESMEASTPTPYNPAQFYRVPSWRSIDANKENVLTFCSKRMAIRDSANMVIACAGDDGIVWSPPRCPPGTQCLPTSDSAFLICCPVANSRR